MFKIFNEDEIFLYDLEISDEFDGMMPVSNYLLSKNYNLDSILFISKCLSVFARNGWEGHDISLLTIIGFPLSVQDYGSSETKKAVAIKQSNNGTTLMLSEIILPGYYDKYLIENPYIPDSCYKYLSFINSIVPKRDYRDAPFER